MPIDRACKKFWTQPGIQGCMKMLTRGDAGGPDFGLYSRGISADLSCFR